MVADAFGNADLLAAAAAAGDTETPLAGQSS
jgi:hypothetical protein